MFKFIILDFLYMVILSVCITGCNHRNKHGMLDQLPDELLKEIGDRVESPRDRIHLKKTNKRMLFNVKVRNLRLFGDRKLDAFLSQSAGDHNDYSLLNPVFNVNQSIVTYPYVKNVILQNINNLSNEKFRRLIASLPNLKSIKISSCKQLRTIDITHSKLKKLEVFSCNSLKILNGNFPELKVLEVVGCDSLKILDGNFLEFKVGCCDHFITLSSALSLLNSLVIDKCTFLERVDGNLSSLNFLSIDKRESLQTLSTDLLSLNSLGLSFCHKFVFT